MWFSRQFTEPTADKKLFRDGSVGHLLEFGPNIQKNYQWQCLSLSRYSRHQDKITLRLEQVRWLLCLLQRNAELQIWIPDLSLCKESQNTHTYTHTNTNDMLFNKLLSLFFFIVSSYFSNKKYISLKNF